MQLKLLVPITPNNLRVAWFGAAAAGLLLAAVLPSILSAPAPPPPARIWVGPSHATPELPDPWPLSMADQAARTVEGRFRSGNTLAGVLGSAGITATVVDAVAQAARPQFDLKRIRAGRPYKIYFDAADELMLVSYQPDPQTALVVARSGDGWHAARVSIPYRIKPRFVRAYIHGSMEGSLGRTTLGRRGAINISQRVADIFAWDVDFAADLQPGDRLDLIVEERYLGEEFAGHGEVLAAELQLGGRTLAAALFRQPDRPPAYFSPQGESLRRAFLRSPVRYTRISSRFSYRRYHPVLKVRKPHLGVDYAAPPGTPVQATANGIVSFIGSNAQAGRYIKIRHGGSYTSWYLHLSRFAEGLHRGTPVVQGQTIGYVGNSGLATSYHLDYRLSRNDEFVDPLRVQSPVAEPVPAEQMAAFASQRDRWMNLLREGQREAAPALAGGGGS